MTGARVRATTSRTGRWAAYASVGVASVLTVPLLFGFLYVLGLALAVGGWFVAAFARNKRVYDRGLRAVGAGGAVLAGPVAYIALAMMR